VLHVFVLAVNLRMYLKVADTGRCGLYSVLSYVVCALTVLSYSVLSYVWYCTVSYDRY
jgi:hypothetical protein